MTGDQVVWMLLLTLGGGAVYLVSCALHPFWPCSACNRTGESRAALFVGAFGPCRRCKGTGRRLRAGARLLGRKS